MASINFNWGLTKSDPEEHSVLIVGQVGHLAELTWEDVRCKLEPRVSKESFLRGVSCASAAPGETVEVWPRAACVAALPTRRSRHAAPSRAHALAKIVRSLPKVSSQHIVLVTRKSDVLAQCVAVARSYPLYCARSGSAVLANTGPTVANSGVSAANSGALPAKVKVELKLVCDNNATQSGDSSTPSPTPHYLLDTSLSTSDLQVVDDVTSATRRAARLTDVPTNYMNVDTFVQEAFKVAKELEIPEPLVIRGEELKERGFGGIYGVGKAANCPPALVVLSYKAKGATKTVAWVGKGIVYDTGGLSIKSRTAMVGMKGDCGGAAGILGAFWATVRASPSVNLHAVLCLAENAVGPDATRPDDIHTLYSGRTVEINNTDAEGRLVLSDGAVYAARDLQADLIVDMATLTGAQGIATGKYHAAILSNRSSLESATIQAGQMSADLTHAVPYCPELHFGEFSSQVADMKNSVADRNNAQVSCAGLFVMAHVGFDFRGGWLHVDMAAPGHEGERATGYGVALLTVLFGAHTESKLLQALGGATLV